MWGGTARAAARRASIGVLACAVVAPAVAGCAPDPPDVPQAAAAPDGNAAGGDDGDGGVGFNGITVTVQALDNTFRPQDLVVAVGTEVVFDNVGRNEHNVIPEPDSIQGWGVGEDAFAPGDVYAHVFTEPGVYAYVCTIHGVNGKGMVGTVTVEAAD